MCYKHPENGTQKCPFPVMALAVNALGVVVAGGLTWAIPTWAPVTLGATALVLLLWLFNVSSACTACYFWRLQGTPITLAGIAAIWALCLQAVAFTQ